MIERRVIAVEGIVQGVGFRPYVHRLATSRKLDGSVRNGPAGLVIDVQGDRAALDDFLHALTAAPPPLAVIASVATVRAEVRNLTGFSISPSAGPTAMSSNGAGTSSRHTPQRLTLVSPDIATCGACLAELLDPENRRHEYAFINCTDCGPRLTIIHALPYDRPSTTMAGFAMCDACRREYEDPSNRRFHAQPIACADCGPALSLHDPMRDDVDSSSVDPLRKAAQALKAGRIVAIKGLGGYHIACDAMNVEAIDLLRARKHREAKPFAVMAPDVERLERLCEITPEESLLLQSRERPIVLLRKRRPLENHHAALLEAVAPCNMFMGAMLPYTPLHHLLLSAVDRPLVMTSGNLTDEPIAFEDDDAIARLSPIADLILAHDRPIATRCDDSVMRVVGGTAAFIRRSRGFAPRPLAMPLPFPSHTLAVGGHLKNTFCLGRDKLAFVSHHIGDLENTAAYRALEEGIDHYSRLVGVYPKIVVHDLHAGYMSSQIAQSIACEKRLAVQHHHAHVASCMAENRVTDPVIGVAFDGAGLGADGAIWGGEFLLVDGNGYRRVGYLGYVPLPGGDAAARRPLRMAFAHLYSAFGGHIDSVDLPLRERIGDEEKSVLVQMVARGINSPPTSSIGRLFDAVASLAGIRDDAAFEGQAAMELEAIADTSTTRRYRVDITSSGGCYVADPGSIIRAVAGDLSAGIAPAAISGAFHSTLSDMIVAVSGAVREETGVNRIALSGGVFQNVLLATRSAAALATAGFEVFQQRLVPCNDGGLSLGQAYVVALGSKEA